MTAQTKPLTLSVGIPAYNSGSYIAELLKAVLAQKEVGYVLKEVIVYCDACSDNTVQTARSLKDPRVNVIDNRVRGGMARGLVEMLHHSKSELFVLLNDDIKISDHSLLQKVIKPFQNKKVGLVSGNPQPTHPQTLIEAAGVSTFRAYERVRYSIDEGNNKWSCDGKFLVFSRDFIQSIHFPNDYKEMANVDAFLFFSCVQNHFLYKHVRSAQVYFHFPRTVKDYVNWNSRNNSDIFILRKKFGTLVDKHFRKPSLVYLKAIIIETLKNPSGCIIIFLLGVYSHYKALTTHTSNSPTWDVISSTKL